MTDFKRSSITAVFQAPEILTSLDKLKDLLPFQSEELEHQLIETARTQVRADSEAGLEKLYEYLVSYTKYLPHSPELEIIRTHEELIENFVWFVTKPMREAERDVRELESEIYDIVTQHDAMKLKNYDFRERPEESRRIIGDYCDLCYQLAHAVRDQSMRVKALEAIFVDAERLALVMRDRLHGLSNILTIQHGNAHAVLSYGDNDIERASYLKAMQSLIAKEFDLFPNLKQVYKGFPEVTVEVPNRAPKVPRPLETRNIIHHLIINALKEQATSVTVSLASMSDKLALITVIDDVPGGMPNHVRTQLGKKYIQHTEDYDGGSGWVIICQRLLPQLGKTARISVETPFIKGNGSRVTIAVPLELLDDKLLPPGTPEETAKPKRITETNLTAVDEPVPPVASSPDAIATVTPINGIAAITERGTPDVVTRIQLDPSARAFYNKSFFDRFRASGMRMFSISSAQPLVLTYTLRPWAR